MSDIYKLEETVKAQADAWFNVCRTLDIVFPGWMSLKPTVSASAVEAISRLGSGAIRIPCPQVAEAERKRLQAVSDAAEKLVRCKGRYHSELNYRALAGLFGVSVPHLPPMESDDVE